MKQVFNSSEVAHIWAAQKQTEGRNAHNNFYFRGKTIYSYGSHFPIATLDDKGNVLFTLKTYSNTTAKHISRARQAVSHKNFIYCYDVLTHVNDSQYIHEKNLNQWEKNINSVFSELGNKRIRDIESRVNKINNLVSELKTYVDYFKITIKDAELKSLLKIVASDNFLSQAREAKAKQDDANKKLMVKAEKAYQIYLNLWRKYDTEAIKELSPKVKELCNVYNDNKEAFTRLRYNVSENRVETSKGVQIPVAIAKRAYNSLNGCLQGNCIDLNIPVLDYTITEANTKFIKAGCHTIPQSDVMYIANLLNWAN